LGSASARDSSFRYRGFLYAAGGFVGYAGITFAGAAFGGLLAIIDEALIARFLGVAAYGLYALAFMLARIGSIIAAFGLPVTILHFLPIHLRSNDRARALGSIIGGIMLPLAMGSALTLLLGKLDHWIAVGIFDAPQATDYIRNLGFIVPLIALSEVLGHTARGFGRAFYYVLIRNLAPQIFFLGVLLYLSHFGGPKIAVTYGLIGSYLLACALGFVLISGLVRSIIGKVRPLFELRALYSYALPVVLNASVALVLLWTDLFQLGIFTNTWTVGIYRACMQIVVVFDIITSTFAAAVGPIYPVLIHERRQTELRDTYLAAIHLPTLLATPIFLLILVNASDLLSIIGPHFTPGAPALCILAAGHLLRVSFGTAAMLLVVGGKPHVEAGNAVIAALLNTVLNLVLIPRFGLAGAATSTATSIAVLSGLRIFQVSRVFEVKTFDQAIFRVVVVTVPLGLAASWVGSVLGFGQGTGIPHLLVRLIVVGGLICAALWFTCLNQGERNALRQLLRGAKTGGDSRDG